MSSKPWYLSAGGSVGARENSIVQTVPAVTLDHLRSQNDRSFDLLKIDVEGHQPAILRGAHAVLASDGPDIMLECVRCDGASSMEALLLELGYRFS